MATLTIQCGAGDCWADKGGNFSATGTLLYVIDSPGVTNSNVRTWIPFTIPLRNVKVNSAFITIRSTTTQGGDGTIRFSCEAADNVTTPVSAADLNGRPLSTYQQDHIISGWVAETDYTFKIDNPIQETLQRSGWKAGNTLAVIITDVDLGDNQRSIYSYEGSLTYRAYLTINYDDFVPLATGIY